MSKQYEFLSSGGGGKAKIKEAVVSEALKYRSILSVLIVTATTTETEEVLSNLKPLPNVEYVIKAYHESSTFYVGLLGAYGIVLVQSGMGSVSAGASLLVTMQSISLWHPKAVMAVGIAFGINNTKQRVGDVLVSSHIIPYEFSRVGEQVVYRSELPPASQVLRNRVQETRDWSFRIGNSFATVYLGPILTGEKLIDNIDFRSELLKQYPNAIGGEMESAGVYAAANNYKVDWIVIKAICDFADGNKSLNKEVNQQIAIKSAVDFTKRLLTSEYAFAPLQFQPLTNEHILFEPGVEDTSRTKLTSIISLLRIDNKETSLDIVNNLKVAAHEIPQTEARKEARVEAERIAMIIPSNILSAFETRINKCWDKYNRVLENPDLFEEDVEQSTFALMKCICKELQRIQILNRTLPEGVFSEWWEHYGCKTTT